MNKIIKLIALFAFFSCSNNPKVNKKISAQPLDSSNSIKMDSNAFSLNTFSNIPEEIDGCGCYFYLSQKDELQSKFIFVNDFANIAYVSINGKVEKFELNKHIENSNFYFYSNSKFKLKIEITKRINMENESVNLEGKILLSNGYKVLEKHFIGVCGC